MIKNKKADAAIGLIIPFIMVLIAAVVIFLFLFRLNFPDNLTPTICHESVVKRATAIATADELKNLIPLKCQTQYICISKDGTCEDMVSPTIKKVNTKNEVYSILAQEMTNCWWMFGEGNVDYMGTELMAGKNYCSLCSQISFDDSLQKIEGFENGEMDELGFYDYLAETKISGKDTTYWDYLYEIASPEEVKEAFLQENAVYLQKNIDRINKMCQGYCKAENIPEFCGGGTQMGLITPTQKVWGNCDALSRGNYIDKCSVFSCSPEIESEPIVTNINYIDSIKDEFKPINLDKPYFVAMGITSKTSPWLAPVATVVAGGAALVVGAFTGGAGWLILAAEAAAGGFSFVGLLIEGQTKQQFLRPTLVEASEDFEKLKCVDINTLS